MMPHLITTPDACARRSEREAGRRGCQGARLTAGGSKRSHDERGTRYWWAWRLHPSDTGLAALHVPAAEMNALAPAERAECVDTLSDDWTTADALS